MSSVRRSDRLNSRSQVNMQLPYVRKREAATSVPSSLGSQVNKQLPVARTRAATTLVENSFGTLPVVLIQLIISKYLTINEWSKLDIALCTHHEVRKLYLEVLGSEAIKLSIDIKNRFWDIFFQKGILKWIVVRGINVESIIDDDCLTEEQIVTIANKLLHLKTLHLRRSANITSGGLRAIADGRLFNLKILHIDGDAFRNASTYISNKIVGSLADSLRSLESLSINLCSQLNDTGLKALANGKLHNLQSLDISMSGNITDAGLNSIVIGLTKLKELGITHCCKITCKGIIAIANGLPDLQSLIVRGCNEAVTDTVLGAIAKGLRNLKLLDISYCDRITDVGIASIVGSNLESLKINGCDGITDTGASAIADGLPNLHTLDIGYCDKLTDAGAAVAISRLHHLKTLKMSAGAVDTIAIDSLNNLQSLSISHVTDAGLRAITRGLSNLKSLIIKRSDDLTDEGFMCLTRIHSLEEFEIDDCDEITDVGVVALVKGLPNLKSLSISSHSEELTDAIIGAIIQALPNLQSLHISGFITIADAAIKAIVDGLRNLQDLYINLEAITHATQTIAEKSRIPILRIRVNNLYLGNFLDDSDIDDAEDA